VAANGLVVHDDSEPGELARLSDIDRLFAGPLEDRATDLKDEIFANDLEFILSD
jgi:hypothetical protein